MTQHSRVGALEGDGAAPSPPGPTARRVRRRTISIAIFTAAVIIALAVGAWYYVSGLGVEETDDAFIAGDVLQVAPRIAGRLKSVPVNDNQSVKTGDLLAEIDSSDQQAAADQARAALALSQAQLEQARVQVGLIDAATNAAVATAQAQVSAAEAKLQQEQAELDAAKAEASRAEADLQRYSALSEQAVSRQRLDVVRATAVSAGSSLRAAEKTVASGQADVAAAQSRLNAAQADRQRVEASRAEVQRWEAEVRQAEAALRRAELTLSYTVIVAPAPGRVTNKAVEPGDYVREGRTLMALVPADVWVVANFKETQLRAMKSGQRASVHIDAYGVDLPAHLESIQAGSGAQFSLLPPQNATGNYVKVVQRIPVKIVFDDGAEAGKYLLGPGMSVVPRVYTR